jgi:hypothetical protein
VKVTCELTITLNLKISGSVSVSLHDMSPEVETCNM